MKSLHSGSCSCASCAYGRRSKGPSNELMQGGSEIDKLYYGKYLPLRERNLLQKLIRTRDFYDDVRDQLLSSSSSSDQTLSEYKNDGQDDRSTKSSAVREMVDLVERGKNSCCTCCSCETLMKIKKHMKKHKYKQYPCVHGHLVNCEDITKYCAEAAKRAKKRRKRLSTKISSKIGAARIKIKKNLSEPCACTLSLTSVAITKSKAFVKNLHSKKKAKEYTPKVVTITQKGRIAKRKKVKNIRSSTSEVSGSETSNRRKFRIKKDSLILFKEKLLKKRPYEENKDVECEPGTCNEGECVPEECLTKIKAISVGNKRKRHHTRHFGTGRDRSDISVSSRTKKRKVRGSQVQIESSPYGNISCECKSTKTKSISSNTSFSKQKSVTAPELKGKRLRSPKQKPQGILKEPVKKKKTYKTERYPLKNTESSSAYSQTKREPKSKSSYSMTTMYKAQRISQTSKPELKRKRPMSPKPRQEKAYKTTKSTASMTSVSKERAKAVRKEIKTASKTMKPKAKLQIRGKDRPLEETVLVQVSPKSNVFCECPLPSKISSHRSERRHKHRREPYENLKETELRQPSEISSSIIEEEELEEPVITNREKVMKSTHGTIKERSKIICKCKKIICKCKTSQTHLTRASSKASQQSYFRESKSHRGNDLPFPRECEPSMCIPYECDPKKCAQILLSRSKSRSRTVSSSTERLKRKSKYIQSKTAVNLKRKPKHISNEPPAQKVKQDKAAINSQPQKQAVRISSSFSFDIEFYKEQSGDKVEERKDLESGHQKTTKQKEQRIKFKDHGTRSRPNISSQSGSSQSLIYQVGHKLKRCFCTLKLLQKKKKIGQSVSKTTMAAINPKEKKVPKKQTQTKPSEISYITSSATSTQTIFCECSEIMKQRNRKITTLVSKETNTAVTPRKSKVACTCESVTKSTSRKTQSSENRNIKQIQVQKQKPRQKRRYPRSSKIESKVSSDKSERQAVRIGSNFSFNVEFSKTKNYHQDVHEKEPDKEYVSDKPIKKEKRHLQQKGIKAIRKPRVQHKASEMTKYVKSKQTRTEPFLQRCFCTLKLLKKNKKKVEIRSPWRKRSEYVMHMQRKSITTNRAEIRYNHERQNLLPYKCETGLSIPEECCPNNRKKFIQFSQMKLQHNYSNISDLVSRSSYNKTLRNVTPSKSRNTQSLIREKAKYRQNYNEISIMPSRSKQQVMRVGSKLSLNIELSKNKISPYKSSKDNFLTTEDLKSKHTYNIDKFKTVDLQQFMHPAHHKSKDTEAKRKDKGNSIGSVIKRCFCALKFQKKRNKTELDNKSNLINESMKYSLPLPNSPICDSKLPYDLSSFKFAPSFWIPEICDPYECYETTKQREIKGLHDRYVSGDKHDRKSVMSVPTSDFSIHKKTKSTQSRLLKPKTKDVQKVRDKQKKLKAVRSFSPSRQMVRKEINLSFNKEISKNHFLPSVQDTINKNQVEKYNTVSELSTIRRTKYKEHCLPQANIIRKGGKASNIGFLLKRCFCTLGLQKKNIPKREFQWNQPITTQFVQVEQNKNVNIRHNITKPECRNVLTKTLYGGEPLELKLPEDGFLFKENLFGNQNGVKNPYCYDPQYLPSSCSFSKPAHVRSRIDFNFDKMRYLLSPQRINPFYQSFYAMNVKISKTKYIMPSKYRALEENSRGSACDECDPLECAKKENQLKLPLTQTASTKPSRSGGAASMIHSGLGDAAIMKMQHACYEKCKAEFQKNNKKSKSKGKKKDKGADSPMFIGSDVSVKMGVYKDTDPHKNKNHKAIRMGSDVHAKVDFFQATESKATGIPHKIQKCFCKSKLKKEKEEAIENQKKEEEDKKNKKKKKSKGPKAKECTCPKDKETKICPVHQQQESLEAASKKSLKKNSVSYGSNFNVDCEFFKLRSHNQKLNLSPEQAAEKYKRIQEKGDGDVEKQNDSISEKKRYLDKLREKCKCCSPFKGGKQLTEKPSLEVIQNDERKRKRREAPLETQSERELETLSTIMPYSKKKFKKFENQSKVGQRTIDTTDLPVCPCDSQNKITKDGHERKGSHKRKDSKKSKSSEKAKDGQETKRVTFTSCSCSEKKQGKKSRGKNKNMEESVCPMCKAIADEMSKMEEETDLPKTTEESQKKDVPKTAAEAQKPDVPKPVVRKVRKKKPVKAKPPVDNTPLFEMTVNKTNMKIVNRDEVLKNLGSTGKESEAMKKARKAIEKGNVDPPLVEMIVDKKNASIINQDKAIKQIDNANVKKVTQSAPTAEQKALEKKKKKELKALAKSHPKYCKCCICTANKKKGKRPLSSAVQFHMAQHMLRPCICGSIICKKDVEKMRQEQRSLANVKIRTCVCGSNICAEESSKMPELLLEASRQAEREKVMAKRAKIKALQYQKARKERAKQFAKKDEKLWKMRKKEDKREMKSIKKTKTDGSIILVTESLIDLGTFGSKAFCDIARTIGRGIRHPRDSYHNVRDSIKIPGHASKSVKKMVTGMGFYSTLSRIQQRLLKMPVIKAVVLKMEAYPFTNYLVHIADKDPRKRRKKFKKKRTREITEFKCSLYMASMRKRPCLRIYKMCPWFYPHCIGLLQAWKQLTDIVLFLLAVAVWSPCILCMELCRGFVCCCMCQG